MNRNIRIHMPIVYDEVKLAQQVIKEKTGLNVRLLVTVEYKEQDELKRLLEDMCNVWGVATEQVIENSREGDNPNYRKLFYMVARIQFPKTPLKALANVTNLKDHATIIHAITQGYNWLATQNDGFCKLYEPVKHFFTCRNINQSLRDLN